MQTISRKEHEKQVSEMKKYDGDYLVHLNNPNYNSLGKKLNSSFYCLKQQLFYYHHLKTKKYYQIPMFIYHFGKYCIEGYKGVFTLIKKIEPKIGRLSMTRYGIKTYTNELKEKCSKTASVVLFQTNLFHL
jgi:hypothetical protein